jgi:hypothetical protein
VIVYPERRPTAEKRHWMLEGCAGNAEQEIHRGDDDEHHSHDIEWSGQRFSGSSRVLTS